MDRASLIGLNHFLNKDNILVIETPTVQKANETVLEIIGKYADFKTALFLSGGSTPKKLYEQFVNENKLKAGAVGQIDERYKPNSKFKSQNSKLRTNESIIRETGLIDYIESLNIRFYSILQENLNIQDTAMQYDEALRFVFKYFPKSVGILGLGADGHTAGLPSGNQKIKNQNLIDINKRIIDDQSSFVTFYEDESKIYGPRITMTYTGLSQLDLIILLVLGQEKREALSLMFKEGSMEEIPARFYLKPEIAEKTILITDQIV